MAALEAIGVPAGQCGALLPILDKRDKIGPEAFEEMCLKAGLAKPQIQRIGQFQDSRTLEEAVSRIGQASPAVLAEQAKLAEVMRSSPPWARRRIAG